MGVRPDPKWQKAHRRHARVHRLQGRQVERFLQKNEDHFGRYAGHGKGVLDETKKRANRQRLLVQVHEDSQQKGHSRRETAVLPEKRQATPRTAEGSHFEDLVLQLPCFLPQEVPHFQPRQVRILLQIGSQIEEVRRASVLAVSLVGPIFHFPAGLPEKEHLLRLVRPAKTAVF